jgi:hypothetical protein
MNALKNILTTISAAFYGLFPALFFWIIALLIYNSNRGAGGITASIIVSIIGVVIGIIVYNSSKRRGLSELFLRSEIGSPDYDNLDPTEDFDFLKLSVAEYIEKFSNGKSLIKSGFISIWGDFRGRQLDVLNEIESIMQVDLEKVQISFKNKRKLTVWHPELILESGNYLKLIRADRVRWEWRDQDGKQSYCDYRFTHWGIKTETNTDWKIHRIDTLPGEPAVEIMN